MSDYTNLAFCSKCKEVTSQHFMDNVPRHHEYTMRCTVCGHEEWLNPECDDTPKMTKLRQQMKQIEEKR